VRTSDHGRSESGIRSRASIRRSSSVRCSSERGTLWGSAAVRSKISVKGRIRSAGKRAGSSDLGAGDTANRISG
jgi:hypothetical protein